MRDGEIKLVVKSQIQNEIKWTRTKKKNDQALGPGHKKMRQ